MSGLAWSTRCRDSLAHHALAAIPRLLTLQDRTPPSPTYGCFDRAYWHYRMMDFPCGMSQEYVLPLALAWALDMPGNPFYRAPEIRRWAEAGIRFAARSAHRDGSCDDYYPFERAAGAAAFSLFAGLEAARLLGLEQDRLIADFFARRAEWLAEHEESGRLSNHEALIVACLSRVAERDASWEAPLRRRLDRLLSWQSGEGWFTEYDGADPGYLSLTIGLLTEVDRRRPELGLRDPIARAVSFLGTLIHPDGSIGGSYTSRGTVSFFPHGLEIAGAWLPEALALNELALRPLVQGRQPCHCDDRIVGHHLWSWMLAWSEWRPRRVGPADPIARTIVYPEARLLVDVRGATRLYCGWSRGAAFQIYDGVRLLHADSGPSIRMKDGRVAVTHLEGAGSVERGSDGLVAEGPMAWSKTTRLTPARSVLLRLVMITAGRFFPDLVRRFLQALLVTGRREAPFRFERRLEWRGDGWAVTDRISPLRGWEGVAEIGADGFQTSVTTVMARVWQPEQLQPWEDWSDHIRRLAANQPLVVQRLFRPQEGGS